MRFARPEWLHLLWLLPALAIFFAVTARRARQELARFGSPELLARAGAGVSVGLRRLKLILLFTGLALVITALAQPQWGATREKIERKGVEVAVVLDTSLSMNATDVAPSRLHKAKQAIIQLIEIMQGDSIAIVVFAGEAFTLCPLTLDYNAARMFVDIIDAEIVPEPGTNIAAALREAAQNFDEKSVKHKVILLISDGEDLESERGALSELARELHKKGAVIHAIGVGSPEGAPIPVETPQGVVDKTDRQGNVVISRLDEATLIQIARSGGGEYRLLSPRSRGGELAEIYARIAKMDKKTFEEMYQVNYEDRFQIFLGLALLCLFLEAVAPDRKGGRKT